MLNILFYNPPFKGSRFSRTSRSPAVTKGGTLYYPFWLAYAAGVAGKAGFSVRLVDAPAEGLALGDSIRRLGNFTPQLIVVDTSTPSIYSDVEAAGRLKRQYPDSFTVLVGTHPSALPGETLSLSGEADAVAVGEYDYTVRDLAQALAAGEKPATVPGLCLRNGAENILTPPREKIKNLDDLPFVSTVYKEHLDYRNYFFAAASYPMMMIITGRGCPHRCNFCVYPQVFHSRKYRGRSPENVVEEFEFIRKEYPRVREIGIEDDTFSANKPRVAEICELLLQRNIKIKWYCNVRGDLKYPLLRLMKRAGCRLVTVGFESGVQGVLDNINKGEKVETYRQFSEDARRAGVLVHGCIMVGNPGDTKETLRQSYRFAEQIKCDSMQFYPLYVYPGTEAYNLVKENGYLRTEDFSQWLTEEGLHNCVHDLPGLSSEEMVAFCDKSLKRYHLRPGYLFYKGVQALRHPREGLRSMKSAAVLLGHMAKGNLKGG